MNTKMLRLETTLLFLLFSLAFINGTQQQQEKKSHSASITVVGRVLCITCSAGQTYYIPGAQVGLSCTGETGETDSRGMFRIELPSASKINNCTVNVLGSTSLPFCNVPFLNHKSKISIKKSRLNGHFIYRAPPLGFRPPFCKKPSRIMSSQGRRSPAFSSKFDFPIPLPPLIPPIGDLPPIPFIPIPPISLPPLFPPFGDLPPIPFWPPIPDVPINPPFNPPPPPPISSFLSPPPPLPPS